ncbi:MAG: efflux RND transporter periplasmic adaptor subunit [Pseudomonadota bacterium]
MKNFAGKIEGLQKRIARATPRQRWSLAAAVGIVLVSGLSLHACSQKQVVDAPVRPVRVITVGTTGIAPAAELAGEVRARIESRLGFRVSGKIVSRTVEAGQRVKRGQELARIDARDYQLAHASAGAEVAAAQADLDNARNELQRFADLRTRGFVSETEIERKRVALSLAEANFTRAKNSVSLESNRLGDTVLRADADGVIVSVEADAGEVVEAGRPVVILAQDGAREIEVEFPEDRTPLAKIATAEVSLWAQPGVTYPAKLRELSAAADSVTRTFRARYSVQAPAGALALGQSASIVLRLPVIGKGVRLPTTALVGADGATPGEKAATQVWVLDNGIVKRVPVQIAGIEGNDVLVSGLADGTQVVTAGVHVLAEGQKARPLTVTAR